MLKETSLITYKKTGYLVLILILMEHAQRGFDVVENEGFVRDVLILILMEHAQRARITKTVSK